MCIRDSYRAEGPRPLRVGGIESAIRKAASMGDGTTLLFGLDGFRVASVTRSPIGVRQVLIGAGIAAPHPLIFVRGPAPRGNVVASTAVGFDEALRLHKHAA